MPYLHVFLLKLVTLNTRVIGYGASFVIFPFSARPAHCPLIKMFRLCCLLLLSTTTSLPFKYFSYTQLAAHLTTLHTEQPRYATLTTSQEVYGLPTVGTCGIGPCLNYLLTLQDRTHDDVYVPDVFISGELHGDETIGPPTALYLADILVTAGDCVLTYFPGRSTLSSDACKTWFSSWSYTETWLLFCARLLKQRRILISPASNALGFHTKTRTENNIDPNRDFPYDQDPSNCLRTVCGRHLLSIFAHSLIQLSLTFHGGMTAIGYEWGAPSHNHGGVSPDHSAQKAIAASQSRHAGTFHGEIIYPTGPMNTVVYPVKGGFEDWAYASTWDEGHR